MKVQKEFVVARPRPEVWALFQDIPAVAACLPGAEYLGPKEGGGHLGRIAMKVGPFQASFDGEGLVTYDEAAQAIAMEGKGVDRKGASRGRMTMTCALSDAPDGTRVAIDADVQLSGTIAQFGRTGLIQEIASVLIADFARAVEERLPARGPAPPDRTLPGQPPAASAPARPVGGFGLLLRSLLGLIRNAFRRP